ncbi:hypothetical protein C5167_038975 [Papaver somniferum]|uniref:Uncharacterized protein n=1 Tax=Papaver somniferum TaxID=3469 RepID=A0A4Y7IEA8_PAPSO|nr:hypothetical protein C5167_038975 [Papaver somniferum]
MSKGNSLGTSGNYRNTHKNSRRLIDDEDKEIERCYGWSEMDAMKDFCDVYEWGRSTSTVGIRDGIDGVC